MFENYTAIFLLLLQLLFTTLVCAAIVYPAMNCNTCTAIRTCACGKYSANGKVLSWEADCQPCPSGMSCGGFNKYKCKVGSFGRVGECAIEGNIVYNYCSLCPKNSYQNEEGQGVCKPCPIGTANSNIAATSASACVKCAAGFGNSEEASDCVEIGAGSYGDNGLIKKCPIGTANPNKRSEGISACVECGVGMFAAEGSERCQPCPAGFEQPLARSDKCSPCKPGFFAPAGATPNCIACPDGWVTSANASTSCQRCEIGEYALAKNLDCQTCGYGKVSAPASLQCEACAPGWFNNQLKASSCQPCAVGYYSAGLGARECSAAEPGFSTEGRTMSTAPTMCTPGTYASAPSAAQFCLGTPPGTFSNASRSTSFYKCAKGYYQSRWNETACDACPESSYAEIEGLSACRACKAGSWGPARVYGNMHSSICQLCPAGFYSDADYSTECKACPAGTYNAVEGAAAREQCVTVAAGYYSYQSAVEPIPCPSGYYSPHPGATSENFCQPCPPGMFAPRNGTARCTSCPAAQFQNESGKSFCYDCGTGFASPENATSCKQCIPGFYCPNVTTGCRDRCLSCKDEWSFSSTYGAVACTRCSRKYGPNRNGTGCKTVTKTISKTGGTPDDSLSRTATPSVTASQSATKSATLTSSETLTVTATLTGWTDSKNRSASLSASESRETISQSPLNSSTASAEVTASKEITRTKSRRTRTFSDEVSPSQRGLTQSINATLTISDPTDTNGGAGELSASKSRQTESLTETKQIFMPQQPLGLSAAQMATIQEATATTAAVIGIVSAPAAMALSKGIAIMSLVGCPAKNPNTDSYWSEDRVPFPASLVPDVGFGQKAGKFQRGGVAAFIVCFAIAMLIGWFNQETIGKPPKVHHDGDDDDDHHADADEKEKDESNTDETNNKNNNNINRSDDSTTATEEEKDDDNKNNKKKEKDKTHHIPQICFTFFSASLGLWAPQAGFIFSTFEVDDMIFAVLPLAIIFTFIGVVNVVVRRSMTKEREDGGGGVGGIFFTQSFVMMKQSKGRFGNLISPKTAKSILQSPFGRFAFFGHFFWTRPKGEEGLAAQRIISMLGSQLQKFRGPPSSTNFIQTENPFDSEELVAIGSGDDFGMNKHNLDDLDDSSSNRKRGKKAKATGLTDWQEKESPRIYRDAKENTWPATLSVHYLLFSWLVGTAVGFLQGVALAVPATCPTIAWVITGLNLLSAVATILIRPFVIPLRNWAVCALEAEVGISSIIVAVALLTNKDNKHNDPVISKENLSKSQLAAGLQYAGLAIGMICTAVIAFSAVMRYLLLNVGRCCAATQEEMWALRTFHDASAAAVDGGVAFEFSPNSLSTRASHRKTMIQSKSPYFSFESNNNNNNNNNKFNQDEVLLETLLTPSGASAGKFSPPTLLTTKTVSSGGGGSAGRVKKPKQQHTQDANSLLLFPTSPVNNNNKNNNTYNNASSSLLTPTSHLTTVKSSGHFVPNSPAALSSSSLSPLSPKSPLKLSTSPQNAHQPQFPNEFDQKLMDDIIRVSPKRVVKKKKQSPKNDRNI